MKYGVWNMDQETQNGYEITNIGSVAMRIAMEDLLVEMGVNRDDIVHLSKDTWNDYHGEYLIVPVNGHHMQDSGNKELLSMSERIIPVFLSISLNDNNLTPDQVRYFKRYEPIGCRDYRTMRSLRDYGIDAYVSGCMAGTFSKRAPGDYKKVFFADVPYDVLKYVPEDICRDIEFVKHELKVEDIPDGLNPESYTRYIIERYINEARLVVSSRFHGVIIPWSLGIPVIAVNEAYTFRFSSVKKILPFYTRDEFSRIDWNPPYIDNQFYREQTRKIAKKRIQDAIDKYRSILSLSEYLENSDSIDSLIDYYDEAIHYIDRKWQKDDAFSYAFWGVNNNAEAIYRHIQANYPHAKLKAIYDSFKTVECFGLVSSKPDSIDPGDDCFIFVTTFVAGYVAENLFHQKNVNEDHYFICNRRYICETDLPID